MLKRISFVWEAIFILLILIGIVTRLYHLRLMPVALYHDEMDYVYAGEGLARYGSDPSGTWRLEQLRPLRTLNITAELPAVFHAGAQLLFGFGPQSAHIPAAFFGLVCVGLAGLGTHLVWRKRSLTLAVIAITCSNPWLIHISRMGYEAVIALTFQLLFLGLLWFFSTSARISRTRKIALFAGMCIALCVSYFSYHSAKFTMIALVGASVVWLWGQKNTLQTKILSSFVLLLVAGGLLSYSLHQQQLGLYGQRQQELLSLDMATTIVNEQRKLAIPTLGDKIFSNKVVILGDQLIRHYASVFDVNRLVVNGAESGFQFSLIVNGFFYVSTLPFIGIGFVSLWKTRRSLASFMMWFLAVSPFASTITISYQSIFRSALTYFLLLFIAGIGLWQTSQWLSKKRFAVLSACLIGVILTIEVFRFAVAYHSRYPVLSADNHYFFEKVLAGYVQFVPDQMLILSTKDTYSRARSIVEYNQLLPTLSLAQRQQFADPSRIDFVMPDILVTQTCPVLTGQDRRTQIVDQTMFDRCHYLDFLATQSATPTQPKPVLLKTLSSPIDSGTYFYIINDKVCNDVQIPSFIHIQNLSLFNTPKLDRTTFCQTWLKQEIK